MDVFLCFDVEDLVHPESDDVVLDIARALTDQGITSCMCVVGEKARLWERRGRTDVIAAVSRHDVALHSNSHSMHPTVAEYLQDSGWQDGVAQAVENEGAGARGLERIFGRAPCSWGTPGSSWAPQIPAATRLLGVPSNLYCHVQPAVLPVGWYAGQLCHGEYLHLAGGEDTLSDDGRFRASLPALLSQVERARDCGSPCATLFCGHPTRYRFTVFWDVLNYAGGRNTDPADYRHSARKSDAQYANAVANLRTMVDAVRGVRGIRLRPLTEVNRRFAHGPQTMARPAITTLASSVANSGGIPESSHTHDGLWLSPAQALDVLARAYLSADHGSSRDIGVGVREVLGPTTEPPPLQRGLGVTPEQLAATCRETVSHIDANGCLPAAIALPGESALTVGPGPILGAVARALSAKWDQAGMPAPLELLPGQDEPSGARDRARRAIPERLPGWPPHSPDLRLDLLELHTRLQCWSLRPAQATDG